MRLMRPIFRCRAQTAFSLPETIALLSRTPSALNTFLRGLPSRWVAANEGSDSWSAFDIVGHLVIGERADWMPRAKRILEHGETIPFDPFHACVCGDMRVLKGVEI